MAITDLITKIIAEDAFSQTFDEFNSQVEDADKRTTTLGKALGKISGAAIAVGPIVAAAAAVSEYVDKAAEADLANTNLVSSVAAANREFGDGVGTIDSWQQTVADTADTLRVFSDKEVANASARLVDMTKRLGFSEEQMQTLLQRTGDLSAGKVDLEGEIERVSAAMRGEAESAEFLGLSLSETQVMAYAEAQGLVFAQLTDNEKAQLRYALFLEQTNELQGRAGVIAQTTAGQQQALNAQLDNQSAAIGQQLIPLWQGYAAAVGLAAGKSSQDVGLITTALAGLLATLLTVGAGFKTFADSTVAQLGLIKTGFDALTSGENPFTAMSKATEENKAQLTEFSNFITSIPDTFSSAFTQIVDGWEEQGQAAEKAAQTTATATGQSAAAFDTEAVAARAAAEEIAKAHEKALEDRAKATQQFANRVADLEFDHAQKMVRLQQDVARDIAAAQQEAASARLEAGQELAQGLAEIEAGLAQDTADAQRDLARDLAEIDAQRSDARRDRNREIRDIDRQLAQDLSDLEFETGQKRNDIALDLADDRAAALSDLEKKRQDIATQLEADRLQTQEDFADKRLRSEQDFQDALKQINDDFSDEFAEADPFRRKIMEENRREQLAQLEQQHT